jgi:hypothetical protein
MELSEPLSQISGKQQSAAITETFAELKCSVRRDNLVKKLSSAYRNTRDDEQRTSLRPTTTNEEPNGNQYTT